MEVIANDDFRLKKQAPVYENLSASKQRFDEIRRLEAINGQVVLRGKEGRRDKIFPLALAIKRFSKWYVICKSWSEKGFKDQIDELKLVLEELGSKIVEAIVQRQTGTIAVTPLPKFVDTKFVLQLQSYIDQVKLM